MTDADRDELRALLAERDAEQDRRRRWGRRDHDHTLEGRIRHYGGIAFDLLWKTAIPVLAFNAWRLASLDDRVAQEILDRREADSLSVLERTTLRRDVNNVSDGLKAVVQELKGVRRATCASLTTPREREIGDCPPRSP